MKGKWNCEMRIEKQEARSTAFRIPFFFLFLLPASAQSPPSSKSILTISSIDYVRQGLDHAKESGARAVILRIDTPGGLMDAMRDIVESVLNSPVPVITWVGPSGARAASAGFFILLAGDVASMAPGTNSGAAHPVTITGGQIDGVMETKIVNDAAAYIRSFAAKRGRNAEEAEKAVTESKSFTAEEARELNLIDAVLTTFQTSFGNTTAGKFAGSTTIPLGLISRTLTSRSSR
jgi:membrane-bound serine protease (ClpP class)